MIPKIEDIYTKIYKRHTRKQRIEKIISWLVIIIVVVVLYYISYKFIPYENPCPLGTEPATEGFFNERNVCR